MLAPKHVTIISVCLQFSATSNFKKHGRPSCTTIHWVFLSGRMMACRPFSNCYWSIGTPPLTGTPSTDVIPCLHCDTTAMGYGRQKGKQQNSPKQIITSSVGIHCHLLRRYDWTLLAPSTYLQSPLSQQKYIYYIYITIYQHHPRGGL